MEIDVLSEKALHADRTFVWILKFSNYENSDSDTRINPLSSAN